MRKYKRSLQIFLNSICVLTLKKPSFCVKTWKFVLIHVFSKQADKIVAEEKLALAKPALEEAEAALQVNRHMEVREIAKDSML